MMATKILALLALLVVGGCGAIIAQQQAEEQAKRKAIYDSEIADCKAQFPVAPRKNNVNLARCWNEATDRYIRPTGADLDLLALLAAKRIAIATDMDAGKITQEQGAVLMAQAGADAVSEHERRMNAKGSVAAQQQAANAAVLGAINAGSPRTCSRIGNSVTCF